MEVQFEQVIAEKILAGVEPFRGELTMREANFPDLPGKAVCVIGMRRAGKTCFLHQIRTGLQNKGAPLESLVYFNFEDERLAGLQASDLHLIPSTLQRLFPERAELRGTLFLDEIQVVPGWETFVRRMLDEGYYDIFLSGSSARLLSRDIATAMRGRAWEVVIHPFGFSEFLLHHGHPLPGDFTKMTMRKKAPIDAYFIDYLNTGGFPEAQNLAPIARSQLIQGYVDAVLLRDVIERHGITNVIALRWMTRRLLGNPGGLFSVTKFEADLKSQGISVGRETLYDILDHLQDAFLLQAIPVASDSEKRRQVNPHKIYPADPSIGPVFDRSRKHNLGHALEVAVHNQLMRLQAEASYVKTPEGYKVDFLSRHLDGHQCLIQVAADIEDPLVLQREIRALQVAAQTLAADRQLILTAHSPSLKVCAPSPIEILPAWAWMLERN